jgi:hypothetical protein
MPQCLTMLDRQIVNARSALFDERGLMARNGAFDWRSD